VNGSFLDDFDLDGSQDLTDVVLANAPQPTLETSYNAPDPDPNVSHDTPTAPQASGVSREDFDTLAGQLRDTQAQLAAQAEASRRAQYAPQQYQQPNYQSAPDPNLKEQLTSAFYADPVGFIAQVSRAQAQQMVSQGTGDVRLGMAENVVHNFKAEKRTSDPTYKVVEKHFEQALSEIPSATLAQMGPEQARQALTWAYRAAQGDVYANLAAKQRAKTPPPNPPPYGGGGYGAAPSAQAPSGDDAESRMAKYLGLSQSDFDSIQD